MNCHDCARLADGWLDGELDPAATSEFERHVRDCPACGRRTEALRSLASTVRAADLYVRAPAGLQEQVRKALGRERHKQNPWRIGAVRWTAAAAAVIVAGLIGWGLHRMPTGPSDKLLAQEVISAHVRSLMADHLVDVVSSDRHTVKPWFAGKLDFSPDVRDCAADGFPLVGGRLEYVDGHSAAGLVYRHGNHTINVFVWPARHTAARPVVSEANGFHALNWSQNGMEYWAVSDSAEDSLRSLADCLSAQAIPATRR
jgi:anti-sigma factor RsiW